MIPISFLSTILGITLLWFLVRICVWRRSHSINWKREAELILVYICIIVVVRFTFFPFSKVNGQVQPLHLDIAKIWPFRINLLPFVYLFDYPTAKDILINVIGNTTMFIPIGIIWPLVFRQLDTHSKAIAAGIGTSVCIEILQLPFFERCSDIDDLILNALGYLAGYVISLFVCRIRNK